MPMPRMKQVTAPAMRMRTTLSPTSETSSRARDRLTPVAVRPPTIRPTPAMMPMMLPSVRPDSTRKSANSRSPNFWPGRSTATTSSTRITQYGTWVSEFVRNSSPVSRARART